MNKKLLIGIIIAVGVVALIIALTGNKQKQYGQPRPLPLEGYDEGAVGMPGDMPGSVTTTETTTDATTANDIALTTYTLADVALHNTEESCWSAINGTVYDLTSWITQHPGGSREILQICGIDGSSAYDQMHGSDPRANNILDGFEIGTLAA